MNTEIELVQAALTAATDICALYRRIWEEEVASDYNTGVVHGYELAIAHINSLSPRAIVEGWMKA